MVDNENQGTGILEDVGAQLLSNGIVYLKTANPAGYHAFRVGLKCVAVGSAALDEVLDDDKVAPAEILRVLIMARDYGAIRTLEDLLWGLLKHVKG